MKAWIGCVLGALLGAATQVVVADDKMPALDHVFLIVMENHSYGDIMNNINAPFIRSFAHAGNLATNYFAVGHPSLPNYLEIVGGSNFGVRSDDSPDWHGAHPGPTVIEPFAGVGTDAPVIALMAPSGVALPASRYQADNLGDQLARAGKSWKAYEESLPVSGVVDGVNYSDGMFTDSQEGSYPVAGMLEHLYAVKHNPFAYFASIQSGRNPASSLANVRGFGGLHGLYADLATGHLPSLSFIVPDQCHDMHGMGNAGELCSNDDALVRMGDIEVQNLVGAIHASPAWKSGHNAIVLVWDENSFGNQPNRVVLVVDTNDGLHGRPSNRPYSHFALLKSLEAGFGLPCINHACDTNVHLMSELFQ